MAENILAAALSEASNMTVTENGRPAHRSTKNHLLDFFFRVASLRKLNENRKVLTREGRRILYFTVSNAESFEASNELEIARDLFLKAAAQDAVLAVLILFWLRDARGGAGERQIFRSLYRIGMRHPRLAPLLRFAAAFIPEYGRWDDVWHCLDPFADGEAAGAILRAGMADSARSPLLAKWLPRENRKNTALVRRMADLLGCASLRDYRRTVVAATRGIVEREMSANAWDDIVFEHVPSVAMSRYASAFERRAPESFGRYREALAAGKTVIRASVLYPHEVVANLEHSEEIAEAQWKALPGYVPENLRILPVVDVSGSMFFGISAGVMGVDVAVALGMYCAERQTGPFRNLFMTFSARPELLNLADMGDSLAARVRAMRQAGWGCNTDIDAAMDLILSLARRTGCPQEDMPDILYILSDMQFDEAVDMSRKRARTFLEDWRERFAAAGYVMPHVVFHNLNGEYGNVPATASVPNVSMVSGFSPSIMRHILAGEEITPELQMMEVLDGERYAPLKEALERFQSRTADGDVHETLPIPA